MSYASPSDGLLDNVDFAASKPVPFIAWLHKHGLIHPGCSWECEYQPDPAKGHDGPVFRRKGNPGIGWPAEKIAGGLVVRPKRSTYV